MVFFFFYEDDGQILLTQIRRLNCCYSYTEYLNTWKAAHKFEDGNTKYTENCHKAEAHTSERGLVQKLTGKDQIQKDIEIRETLRVYSRKMFKKLDRISNT